MASIMMQSMDERPNLPNYDSDFCLKVVKWTAVTCVVWLVCTVLILMFVDPSHDRCPGWAIHSKDGGAMSVWVFVGMFTAFPTIWICWTVLRWEHFSQQIYDSAKPTYYGSFPDALPKKLYDRYRPDRVTFPYNAVFVGVNVVWSLFCTLPLWLMLTNCTSLPRYLGY
jgi:hypothetical protein